MARKKYRYIGCGLCHPDNYVYHFGLCSNTQYFSEYGCIRIEVDNLHLNKYSCDSYNISFEKVQIKECNPIVYCGRDKKRSEELTKLWLADKIQPHQFYQYKVGDYDRWASFPISPDYSLFISHNGHRLRDQSCSGKKEGSATRYYIFDNINDTSLEYAVTYSERDRIVGYLIKRTKNNDGGYDRIILDEKYEMSKEEFLIYDYNTHIDTEYFFSIWMNDHI